MNFLGVGVGELLLILLIAMLVVGPERMVQLSAQMGRMLAKFREQSEAVTREFKEAFTLELEEAEEATTAPSGTAASADKAAPAAIADGAVQAQPTDAAPTPADGEAAAPEEPEISPEEAAILEALALEQRLADDMVDGELEVALAEASAEDNGSAADDESYEEVEAIDLNLASVVPEDEDVAPTTVNDVLMIPDEDASAELPLEAEE